MSDQAFAQTLHNFFKTEIYPYVMQCYAVKEVAIQEKSDKELVSEIDLTIQGKVAAFLERTLPGMHLASEEIEASWPPQQDEFVILDPLDGTHNFLMGIPLFGTMFAFIAHGVIEWSTIFLPMEELWGNNGFYFTARGKGSWKYQDNEAIKLRVSDQKILDRAQVLLEGKSKNVFKSPMARAIHRSVLRTRNNISMCWSITRIASGGLFPSGIDVMVSFDNKPSDNLPGVLFVEEAGGRVSDFSGDTVSLTQCKSVIFSNGALHPNLIALGKEAFSG